jgi:hypothetical protein
VGSAVIVGALASCSLPQQRAVAPRATRIAQCIANPQTVVEYRNGLWYGDGGFQSRTMYASGGTLSSARPNTVDTTVDLAGGFVIPPFAEAHNHNVHSSEELDAVVATYLRDGVFYVATLSNLPRLTQPIRSRLNCPTSLDVLFANGPVTASRGHPVRLRERLLEYGMYPGFTRETLRDHGYIIVDSLADVERKLAILLADKPDVVKIILLYSEEYEKRKNDDRYFGQKGLEPALVAALVKRVHREGLRVFAHVGTAWDFRVAVQAGVDVIAHLPGYAEPERIDSAAAAMAARNGTAVITTVSLASRPGRDSAKTPAIRAAQRSNLALLRDAGVNVIIGSDMFEDTSVGEVEYLRALGPYSDAELLEMWAVRTPRALFPNRRIGRLEEGHEASFLVLNANPLVDWSTLRQIKLRVKQGAILEP